MGRECTDFEHSLFLWHRCRSERSQSLCLLFEQGGLGLPDRDYYLKADFAGPKRPIENYVATLLRLLDWPEPENVQKEVIDFETKIAEASWTKAQQRDPVATYNPMTPDELEKFAPEFPWKTFLQNAKCAKLARVIVAEKSAFPNSLASTERRHSIRSGLARFSSRRQCRALFSKPFTDAYFEMRNKTLSGQKEQQVRWKRAITAVSGGDFGVGDRFGTFGTMGFGVGQLYSAKYFPPEAKAKIQSLVS